MKNLIIIAMVLCTAVFAAGCQSSYTTIPPGYFGKVLTPTGYETEFREAGQVDIGAEDLGNGRYNQLILCEATSATIKESFSLTQEEDRRIITRDGVPLTVDVRVQVLVPQDKKIRDSIFAQITPRPSENNRQVSWIMASDIYEAMAMAPIRNRVRAIFMKYPTYDAIIANYDQVNKQISTAIGETFEQTKVPLKLLSGELSNVKADSTVVDAQNRNAAAIAQVDQINKIGQAMKASPEYLEKYKWDVIKELSAKGTTIIINTDQKSTTMTYPVK